MASKRDSSLKDSLESPSSVNWVPAFTSPEFCAGLQNVVADAIAKSLGAKEPKVTASEQLGEMPMSIRVPVVSAPSTSQGTLTAPLFLWIAGSSSATQPSAGSFVNYSATAVLPHAPEPTLSLPVTQ